ncbi:hypothetical protein SAURM35S_01036 [Streptomyces aurantiogriseus]
MGTGNPGSVRGPMTSRLTSYCAWGAENVTPVAKKFRRLPKPQVRGGAQTAQSALYVGSGDGPVSGARLGRGEKVDGEEADGVEGAAIPFGCWLPPEPPDVPPEASSFSLFPPLPGFPVFPPVSPLPSFPALPPVALWLSPPFQPPLCSSGPLCPPVTPPSRPSAPRRPHVVVPQVDGCGVTDRTASRPSTVGARGWSRCCSGHAARWSWGRSGHAAPAAPPSGAKGTLRPETAGRPCPYKMQPTRDRICRPGV